MYLLCAYYCSAFVISIHVNIAHLSFGICSAMEHDSMGG